MQDETQVCSPSRVEGRLAKGGGMFAHIRLGGVRSSSEQRRIDNVPAERQAAAFCQQRQTSVGHCQRRTGDKRTYSPLITV